MKTANIKKKFSSNVSLKVLIIFSSKYCNILIKFMSLYQNIFRYQTDLIKIKINIFQLNVNIACQRNSVGFLTRRKLVYFMDDVDSSMCVALVQWYTVLTSMEWRSQCLNCMAAPLLPTWQTLLLTALQMFTGVTGNSQGFWVHCTGFYLLQEKPLI